MFHQYNDQQYFQPHPNECLRLKIDLSSLSNNWHSMNKLSGTARAGAVVKDNAYGLGLEKIAKTLYKNGTRDFFVANIQEGVELRTYIPQAKIFVLNGINTGQEKHLFEANLIPVIASAKQLTFYSQLISNSTSHPYALQVDTGFNRLGLSVSEALDFSTHFSHKNNNKLSLIMSHLACAENPSSSMNYSQLEKFLLVTKNYKGIEASLSASAGILLGENYHFQLTRPGISLYGGTHAINKIYRMQTVVTAETRIILIRKARAGEIVSYNGQKKLTRDSIIAVASIGYADGYPITLSGIDSENNPHKFSGGKGFVKDCMIPILGKITMDMTMFDITDYPEIELGDYIQIFGPDLKLDDVALAAGTTNYDILVKIGNRYARYYK
ncbi:MAG: alanine racemase [Candidatus Liberibacter europaeus]|uniref:Alanine racemase n=1 Tax=Candidatus Liberibacter europaeus TaxID=744859 RepID=A0A2T4VXV3_9HYPH|nr:alanine racemase [Candidatus Liberibacter europaeus]PTL86598.1 MAG: alanine racemase [Candidatus Liberibacter europaeus]